MVEIKIDERYLIKADESQWILAVYSRGKYKNKMFFTSLEHLLKELLQMKLRQSDATSIQELLELEERFIIGLNEAIKPLKVKVVNTF